MTPILRYLNLNPEKPFCIIDFTIACISIIAVALLIFAKIASVQIEGLDMSAFALIVVSMFTTIYSFFVIATYLLPDRSSMAIRLSIGSTIMLIVLGVVLSTAHGAACREYNRELQENGYVSQKALVVGGYGLRYDLGNIDNALPTGRTCLRINTDGQILPPASELVNKEIVIIAPIRKEATYLITQDPQIVQRTEQNLNHYLMPGTNAFGIYTTSVWETFYPTLMFITTLAILASLCSMFRQVFRASFSDTDKAKEE